MIRVPYAKNYRLPAPVLKVLLGHPDGLPTHPLSAQLDTGSDRTVIPLDTAQALGLSFLRDIQAGVVGGGVLTLSLYEITIRIDGVMDFTLDVAAGDEPHILLGRDVLNALYVTLHGPDRILELSTQPPALAAPTP